MPRRLAAVLLLFAGCDPSFQLDVRVTGSDGAPVDVEVICETWDVEDGGGALVTARPRGGAEFTCDLPELEQRVTVTAQEVTATPTALAWPASATIEMALPSDGRSPDLVLWRPRVTVEEVGDRLVVTWDPPAPQAVPGWEGQQRVALWLSQWSASETIELDAGATTATFAREIVEDFVGPAVRLTADQRGPVTWDYAGVTAPGAGFSYTPVLPASRGSACQTLRPARLAGDPARIVEHAAGACPLSNGDHREHPDGGDGDIRVGTLDLGSTVELRRIRVSCDTEWYGTSRSVELSVDGVSFTPAAVHDPLPAPVAARYVRADCSAGGFVSEVSAFWGP